MFKFLQTAFSYNSIKGAVIVKLVQVALTISGHAPWSDAQASAVEAGVDSIVAILAAFGVHQAHNTDPKA